MNLAYVHLVLCHLPVLFIPLGTMIVFLGLIRKNSSIRGVGYCILVLGSITAIPVFLTGEPAEDIVKNVMGVNELGIHAHEEMAEFSLVGSLIAGLFSLVSFILNFKKFEWERKIALLCVVAGTIASGMLIYTANLGGKIHHIELNPSVQNAPIMENSEVEAD